MERLNQHFFRIRDASADITLDYSLFLFGCSGLQRQQGKGFFKSPDRIKAELNNVTYFARGNRMRKIDENGKRWHVKLLNAPDFSVGFNPRLMTYNFDLTVLQDDGQRIVLRGIPRPGTLKNVKMVLFYLDPEEGLLRELDVKFVNERLAGRIKIDYQKIEDIWVPTGFHGQSAVTLYSNALIGMNIRLKGENIRINTGLSDRLFDPGF